MEKHSLSIRLDPELAQDAQAVARVEKISVNQLVQTALLEAIEQRKADPVFMAQVKSIIEEDRKILDRLAQ